MPEKRFFSGYGVHWNLADFLVRMRLESAINLTLIRF